MLVSELIGLLLEHPQETTVKIEVRGIMSDVTDVDFERTTTGAEMVILTDFPVDNADRT